MGEQDGSFRRLVQMVQDQQPAATTGRTGRPPKNRVPTTGKFSSAIHERMKALARVRTEQSDHLVSVADIYNEAAQQCIEDLHRLLGDEIRLPMGALSVPGILGLRDLVNRPVLTPLGDLAFQGDDQTRTTLYFDEGIWKVLMELSLRFGLQLHRPIHIHRLIELSASWYLAGFDPATK